MPILSINGTTTGAVFEDGITVVSDFVKINDLEIAQDKFTPQIDSPGQYGSFTISETGQWSYSLDNAYIGVQQLNQDKIVTDVFLIDYNGTVYSTITVSIVGKNDAASVIGDNSLSISAVGASNVTGTIKVKDIDLGESQFVSSSRIDGNFGYLSITSIGAIQYTLNAGWENQTPLSSGENGSELFTVTTSDGSTSDVKVNVMVGNSDTTAPTVATFSPTDEAIGIAVGGNITVTFSEAVQRGSGGILLKTEAGVTVATYDAASSTNLTVTGSTLTINPTSDLSFSTGYKVEFGAGTIKDLAGNSYAGTATYNFTTVGATTQTFTGGLGNDVLTGSSGNDSIDGGAGIDTAVYSGGRSSFSLTKTSTGFTVADSTGTAGTDTLQNIERIKFSDGAIALDVGATQPAGQTAMLLGAVLPGRLAFDASKQALLGAAIELFDQGLSLQTLSGAVMRLPIWGVLTGMATPTNTDIATYLLTNVNGVAPDATTLASAVTSLNTETDFATQGNFLWHLAESAVNQTRIDLVGLAAKGLLYG